MAQNKKGTPQNKPDKSKQIIIGIIALIVLLNIMWTIMQNKFTPKLDEFKATIAALEHRIEKLEKGGMPDVAELKEDFAALKAISAEFKEGLAKSIKAEEEQLAKLESQVEAQKARIEELKKFSISSGE
jgi:predicted RNase H-like nuclease (RuvC/YqgF family)